MTLLPQVRRVGRLVWAERRPYLFGVVFVVFSTMTALVYPYVVQLILDDAIGAGQLQKLKPHSRQRSARMNVVDDGLTTCQAAICRKK